MISSPSSYNFSLIKCAHLCISTILPLNNKKPTVRWLVYVVGVNIFILTGQMKTAVKDREKKLFTLKWSSLSGFISFVVLNSQSLILPFFSFHTLFYAFSHNNRRLHNVNLMLW